MYHYRECGLRNVWLANGYDEHDTPYGPGIAIHDVEGLHRAVAHGIVNKGGNPTGAELRFLRQEMDEGNVHIRDMVERLAGSDMDETEARITLEHDERGWKVAAA